MPKPVYGRILLKLSGEILAGDRGFGVDPAKAKALADAVKSARDLGVEVGGVVSLRESSFSVPYFFRGDAAESNASFGIPIEPGNVEVSATVEAVFEIR